MKKKRMKASSGGFKGAGGGGSEFFSISFSPFSRIKGMSLCTFAIKYNGADTLYSPFPKFLDPPLGARDGRMVGQGNRSYEGRGGCRPTFSTWLRGRQTSLRRHKGKERKRTCIAPIVSISTTKRSDVDHTELPANTPHLPFISKHVRLKSKDNVV